MLKGSVKIASLHLSAGCSEAVMSLYQEYIPEARGRVFGPSTPSLFLSGHEDSFPPWPCVQLSGLGQSLTTHTCLLRITPHARLVGVYSGVEGGCAWV